ncbi:uncharacterized protein LOC131543345 isoform X3 [Onychostoma macrolepis]|uniref:uncharacterized protein LOC131543345 isoform X3 n=1 Tax=Onychostoma macrolepis TaxID=369639 RepID=UPI00272B9036|nr:uncharacterized protein LOC131543345 isoform X3 [Onychostoma macrolepis]
MPGGSTKKICPFCQGILFCAQKICLNCKKEQPLKQRPKKKLQRFDEKREEWVVGHKKNHNIASIKDEAIVMDYLQKIGSFYEYLCEGWNQNSSGNDDQLITLHLTPCDSLENTSSREEVRTTQVEETRNMQVEQATIMEGQAEQMSITEGQAERATIMEGQAEQISTTVGQVEQMSITEGQAEQMSTIEGQGGTKAYASEEKATKESGIVSSKRPLASQPLTIEANN